MQVLDQYQSRLHRAGNDAHDEEFEYVRQIVSSPIFHQFLRGEVSQEDREEIFQASQEFLSTEPSAEVIANELTSSEIQRRRLARRKSLKALRNAVIPQSSTAAKKPHPPYESAQSHGALRRNEMNSSSVATATPSPLRHTHTKSQSGSESARIQDPRLRVAYATDHPPQELTVEMKSSQLTNGTDHGTPRELPGGTGSIPPPDRDTSTDFGPRVRNLSNSTNTLIERLSPPVEGLSRGHSTSNGHLSSESHSYVHGLGLNRPEMDKDLFSAPLHVLSPKLIPEWNGKYSNEGPSNGPQPSTHPHLHFPPSPTSQGAPNTYLTAAPLTLTTDARRHPPPAPPPHYDHLHINSPRHKTTFENILNSPEFDPLNFDRTPIPPPMPPQVDINDTGNRVLHFHLMLEKGSEGLGFRVQSRDGGEGGLVVQCLSPGGLAER